MSRPTCDVCGSRPMYTICGFCGKRICSSCTKNVDGHDSCPNCN